MRIIYDEFRKTVKTKSETSSLVKNLWISRAAIGVEVNGGVKPVFGFSAGFSYKNSEIRSTYELLERLVFLPNIYNEATITKPVQYWSEKMEPIQGKGIIKDFLVGAIGPKGFFYGNGCAIANNLQRAVMHSQHELIERHLCCDVWYRNRPLIRETQYRVELLTPEAKLEFYTTNIKADYKFALAVVDCPIIGFFALGAAVRLSLEEAYAHALSEAAMLFEDAVKGRMGDGQNTRSQQLLSLRNKAISSERKKYFETFLKDETNHELSILPIYQSITFEPFPNIYASRTFSSNSLDPRELELKTKIPTLPLF